MKIKEVYEAIAAGTKEVILFGSGKVCGEFFGNLRNCSQYDNMKVSRMIDQIRFIADNDKSKWGSFAYTFEIASPEKIFDVEDKIIIIACSHISEIKDQLLGMGIEPLCIYNYTEWLDFMESIRALEEAAYLNKHADQTALVKSLLFDEESKDIYDKIVEKRKVATASYYDILEKLCDQYFQKEIIHFADDEVFVDAGFFYGDTSFQFAEKTNYSFKRIYAFEPSPINIDQGRAGLGRYNEFQGKIEFINKGISDCAGKAGFIDNHGYSVVADEGAIEIEITTLDNEIHEEVTFIKMDIEGLELAALKGAENIIKKYRPKLAICIYHKIEDLITIPLYIHEIVPEYKLYVRHYSSGHGESVLYAVI